MGWSSCACRVALIVLLAAGLADARLGGGHSFGGGGFHGGGGGGFGGHSSWGGGSSHHGSGGSSDPVETLLIFALVVALKLINVYVSSQSSTPSPARPGVSTPHYIPRPPPKADLRTRDPLFSMPLFLDFVQHLFTRFHIMRGQRRLETLSQYVAQDVLARVGAQTPRDLQAVSDVLIASSKVTAIRLSRDTQIVVLFTANYRDTCASGETTWYAEDRWTFSRGADVRSRPPEEITRLGCPSCGNAEEPSVEGKCAHCGQVVADGSFHWFVIAIATLQHVRAQPPDVSGGEEEETHLPLRLSPTLEADMRALRARHPDFDPTAFKKYVHETFLVLQEAWSEQTWETARSHETDHLFSMHRYWIENYRAHGLKNKLVEIQVGQTTIVKVETDAFYEAITLRISATGLDFTIDRTGKVVGGSDRRPRSFSEYWTFIRRIGHQAKADAVKGGCPSCGAPLKLNMSGVCEYCKSKVTNGDFGWVLSAIDQANEYGG